MLDKYEIWSNDLTKVYYTKNNDVLAVDHINLRISPGIHGFLGPNGAGKTTTINMLMGTISITEGEAYIKGFKAGSPEARRLIGFLPQDPMLYGSMTASEYLTFTAQLYGNKKGLAQKKADKLLQFFDLEMESEKTISEYSGGMKQKVGLASTLIHDPKLLILDEPTTNLDPLGRKSIIEYIKKLSTGMSIFVSSHILSEIEQLCSEVTILVNGKIIITDNIHNLKKTNSINQDQYILDTNSNKLVFDQLSTLNGIKKLWIGDNHKIYINTENKQELQAFISKLIQKYNIIINDFHLLEVPLQDILIKLIEKG